MDIYRLWEQDLPAAATCEEILGQRHMNSDTAGALSARHTPHRSSPHCKTPLSHILQILLSFGYVKSSNQRDSWPKYNQFSSHSKLCTMLRDQLTSADVQTSQTHVKTILRQSTHSASSTQMHFEHKQSQNADSYSVGTKLMFSIKHIDCGKWKIPNEPTRKQSIKLST